jgi:hypothetical protein
VSFRHHPQIQRKGTGIGSMCGSLEITGDIVSPVIETQEIEALRQ